MKKRVIVNGAFGKMGALACQTLQHHPSFELVGSLKRGDDLKQAIIQAKADIVVDLTRADCVYENSLQIINAGANAVIGTSGLLEEQIEVLKRLCDEQQLGALVVPNFSLSAVLMMKFSAMAARFLPEVEIIEMHHQQKLDAPSGTAIKTADMIASARTQDKTWFVHKELLSGARGATYHDIAIHSLRLPGVLAKQHVVFGNTGETLTITHDSIDRSSFMPGVILACQHVGELKTLYYGLEHLL